MASPSRAGEVVVGPGRLSRPGKRQLNQLVTPPEAGPSSLCGIFSRTINMLAASAAGSRRRPCPASRGVGHFPPPGTDPGGYRRPFAKYMPPPDTNEKHRKTIGYGGAAPRDPKKMPRNANGGVFFWLFLLFWFCLDKCICHEYTYAYMTPHDLLAKCDGFEWDRHNADKIWLKHRVSPSECEQVFFNLPLVVAADSGRSEKEKRFYVLGRTDAGRFLFVVFTVRGNNVRVISARDMSRKERRAYQTHEEDT